MIKEIYKAILTKGRKYNILKLEIIDNKYI